MNSEQYAEKQPGTAISSKKSRYCARQRLWCNQRTCIDISLDPEISGIEAPRRDILCDLGNFRVDHSGWRAEREEGETSIMASSGPNLLFIPADVSCYGRRDFDAHIDRFATEGVRFTQAYANSAVCTPPVSRWSPGATNTGCRRARRAAVIASLVPTGFSSRGCSKGTRA
jgi:hypothetical protein